MQFNSFGWDPVSALDNEVDIDRLKHRKDDNYHVQEHSKFPFEIILWESYGGSKWNLDLELKRKTKTNVGFLKLLL